MLPVATLQLAGGLHIQKVTCRRVKAINSQ
jgi:hypothetical protein